MSTTIIENAIITNVSISMQDHGCLTFNIMLEGAGWDCNYGGYCIGKGYLGANTFEAESGSRLVAMMKIMDTIGVERWEDLKGKYVRCKLNGWGGTIDEIGNIIKSKWFNVQEFFSNNN